MNKNFYLIGIGAVVIVVLGWFAFSQGLFSPSEVVAPDEKVMEDDSQTTEDGDVVKDDGDAMEKNGDEMEEDGDAMVDDGDAMEVGNAVISFDGTGYVPSNLEISAGDMVTFENNSGSRITWPASVIHPTHTIYPGSSIGKCGTGEADTIFDACSSVGPGDSYSFTFEEVGEWQYHDHLKPTNNGTITVK